MIWQIMNSKNLFRTFEKVFQYDIIKVQKHILNVVDDIILIKDNVNDSVWISNIINNIPKDSDIVYLGENKDIYIGLLQ